MLARILSSLLFFALFLFGLFSNRSFAPHIIFVIVAAATVLGTHEYYNLARHLHIRPSPWPGHAIALAFLADAFFFQFGDFVYIFITCFWMLLITQVFLKRYDHSVANTACSLFGSIYVGLPLAMLLDVFRNATAKWDFTDPITGGNLVLFLVLTSWATDIGGYCIGKPFGKHKMTPVLSPNKSYEGLAGGAALAVAAGVLLRLLWPGMHLAFSWPEAIGLPILFTLVGVVGDLAQSAFKRDAGIKDSGRTYTGHGGMLDIIDSLLLCAPVFYLYLKIRH